MTAINQPRQPGEASTNQPAPAAAQPVAPAAKPAKPETPAKEMTNGNA